MDGRTQENVISLTSPTFHARHPYARVDSSEATKFPMISSITTIDNKPTDPRFKPLPDTPSSTAKSPKTFPHRRRNYLISWWQEVAACFTSVIAFIALFNTVYAYHGKALPDLPRWLSLNTVIAIYILLLKSGIFLVTAEGLGQLKWSWFANDRPLSDLVKYDEATRGTLGAISLLFTVRARHLLTCLGALTSILALAMDPFAQQIARYYDCQMPSHIFNASIPRTNYYREADGLHVGPLQETITSAVQNSINAGVFGSVQPPAVQCSTGNCTFTAEYSTIGWCSVCQDITSLLTVVNTTWISNGRNLTNVTTSIPGGFAITNVLDDSIPEAQFVEIGPAAQNENSTSYDFLLAKTYHGVVDPSAGVSLTSCDSIDANQSWECLGYGAARCTLNPCVKTYTGSVSAGQFTETLLDTTDGWSGYDPASGTPVSGLLDISCVTSDERQSLDDLGYNVTSRWLAYNVPFNVANVTRWAQQAPSLNSTFPESMAVRGCLYAVEIPFVESISTAFTETLAANVTGGLQHVYYAPSVNAFHGSQVAQAIYNFGNVSFDRVDSIFTNISVSLTNFIRQNGVNGFSLPALGVVNEEKTCISIRWGFLAFPATLCVMTVVFFVLTMLETDPNGLTRGVWKSSPLPLLYHGPGGLNGLSGVEHAAGDMDSIACMQDLARSTIVRLDRSYDGRTILEIQPKR